MALSTITAALYACACCCYPSARGDAPVQGDREWDEDHEYPDAPGEGRPAVRAHGLVEQKSSHRVDNLRHPLVVGEGLQPSRHVVRLYERARGEGQREEPDKPGRLDGLGASHEERDRRPDPGKREA